MKNKYFVNFSSPFTKEEKKLLENLIREEKKELSYSIREIDIPELKNEKIKFIDRFTKKGIYTYENEKIAYIPLFSSYFYDGKDVTMNFNEIFLSYLNDEEKKLKFNLREILLFKYEFSIEFFYKVIKENFLNNMYKIDVDNFKLLIKKDKYKRLYDVKRFLLTPLIEDINGVTNFKLSYTIIKEDNKSIIIFNIKNNQLDELRNYVNNFLKLYKPYILDIEKFKLILFEAFQSYGYRYTKEKLLLAIKNKKKYDLKFDDLFEKFLSNELGEFYVLIKENKVDINNTENFRKFVFSEIKSLNLPEIATLDYNTVITKKIFNLKEEESTEIISENLKISLYYSTKKLSKIQVFLKYIK